MTRDEYKCDEATAVFSLQLSRVTSHPSRLLRDRLLLRLFAGGVDLVFGFFHRGLEILLDILTSCWIMLISGSTDFRRSSAVSLNPLIALPTCRPTSGNCFGPNRRNAITRMMRTSPAPNPNISSLARGKGRVAKGTSHEMSFH